MPLPLFTSCFAHSVPTTGRAVETRPNAGVVTDNLLAALGNHFAGPNIVSESIVKNETFPCLLELTGRLLNLSLCAQR